MTDKMGAAVFRSVNAITDPCCKVFQVRDSSECQCVKIRLRTEFKANDKTGPEGGRISKPTG